MATYKNGTIKLTWVNPSDYTVLESSMYDTIEDAVNGSKDKSNFLIFKLIESSDDKVFKWKLLDYGEYKGYVRGMKWSNSMSAKIGGVVILGLALYGLGHIAFGLKK